MLLMTILSVILPVFILFLDLYFLTEKFEYIDCHRLKRDDPDVKCTSNDNVFKTISVITVFFGSLLLKRYGVWKYCNERFQKVMPAQGECYQEACAIKGTLCEPSWFNKLLHYDGQQFRLRIKQSLHHVEWEEGSGYLLARPIHYFIDPFMNDRLVDVCQDYVDQEGDDNIHNLKGMFRENVSKRSSRLMKASIYLDMASKFIIIMEPIVYKAADLWSEDGIPYWTAWFLAANILLCCLMVLASITCQCLLFKTTMDWNPDQMNIFFMNRSQLEMLLTVFVREKYGILLDKDLRVDGSANWKNKIEGGIRGVMTLHAFRYEKPICSRFRVFHRRFMSDFGKFEEKMAITKPKEGSFNLAPYTGIFDTPKMVKVNLPSPCYIDEVNKQQTVTRYKCYELRYTYGHVTKLNPRCKPGVLRRAVRGKKEGLRCHISECTAYKRMCTVMSVFRDVSKERAILKECESGIYNFILIRKIEKANKHARVLRPEVQNLLHYGQYVSGKALDQGTEYNEYSVLKAMLLRGSNFHKFDFRKIAEKVAIHGYHPLSAVKPKTQFFS